MCVFRIADRKMASLQYRLEDRGATENKYKKQLCTLQVYITLQVVSKQLATILYRLEDRGPLENKYKKQLCTLQV